MTLPDALKLAGNYLRENKLAEAEALYAHILKHAPNTFEAAYMLGFIRLKQGQANEALALIDAALRIKADSPAALMYRGIALRRLNRPEEALASFDEAVALQPDSPDLHNNRGNALQSLERLNDAVASYERALALRPDYVDALNNRAATLTKLRRFPEATAAFDRVIALKPDFADAFHNRGYALQQQKRYGEALKSFERALALKPDHPFALAELASSAAHICDWDRRAPLASELKRHIRAGSAVVSPFVLLAYSDDPELQFACARAYRAKTVPSRPPLWNGTVWRHDRIRIAYVSADFHLHATSLLMAGLFELHDRSRFEVIGVSLGADDKSAMRARLVSAFDQFHDVQQRSDSEVARLLHDLQVDIAIDLKGYTQGCRPGIFAFRPAPIQVSYMGYPGTTGADVMDYLIGDAVVTPSEHQPFFSERLVQLPDCYFVNDSKREIADHTPTRTELGLPETGFVFCCFNNSYKITPEFFDLWMRLLRQVEGSVLWLLASNDDATANLRQAAATRGVDPGRLVFAPHAKPHEHLARQQAADLFLDTLPVNAHTTACDALWVGLPVLTCPGRAMAARVAASALHAIGLPGLVALDLAAYEATALKLATDASALGAVRDRLATNRLTQSLFDTDRSRRHLEAAYDTMWQIWQRGETPRPFRLEPQ